MLRVGVITCLVITWEKCSFEWLYHPLFCLMFLRSFIKKNLLFHIRDPLKRKSPVYSVPIFVFIERCGLFLEKILD